MRISMAISCLVLAGCNANIHPDTGFIDDMKFGQAYKNNMTIQSRPPITALVDLSHEFRAAVPDKVTFDFNSTDLDPTARSTLRRQAAWIRERGNIRFGIIGHADQIGGQDYNHALGQARARVVLDFLLQNGVDRAQLEILVSRGDLDPLLDTGDRERLNRRAVTRVAGLVNGDPRPLSGDRGKLIYEARINPGPD